MNQENIHESEVQEVDSFGGWLVTHHTRTWDTRVPLTELAGQLAEAEAQATEINKKVNDLRDQLIVLQPTIDKLPPEPIKTTSRDETSSPKV